VVEGLISLCPRRRWLRPKHSIIGGARIVEVIDGPVTKLVGAAVSSGVRGWIGECLHGALHVHGAGLDGCGLSSKQVQDG